MNTNSVKEREDAVEALAVWECNRRSRWYKENGGASSFFHECLPETQNSFRAWAVDVLTLVARIKGDR